MWLIDADALIAYIKKRIKNEMIITWLCRIIGEVPAIEAEPVRHGQWVIEKRHEVSCNPYMDDNYFASATCSECGFCIHAETKSFGYPDLDITNYCPNCGCKMSKE